MYKLQLYKLSLFKHLLCINYNYLNCYFGNRVSWETTGCGFQIINNWLVCLTYCLISLVNDSHMNSLCRLPEKGRKEIVEIVKEMKERDREERRTGIKREETEEIKTFPLYPNVRCTTP